jgi:hypothetical protein
VRKVTAATGIINTVAGSDSEPGFSGDGGPATSARLFYTWAISLVGGSYFIVDQQNLRIRKVTAPLNNIATVAGNGLRGPALVGDGGPAVNATIFNSLFMSIAADPFGVLYLSELTSNRVRAVSNGIINTIAGTGVPGFFGDGGPALNAQLNGISGIAVDSNGNIFLADTLNHRIRKIDALTQNISTIAGGDFCISPGDGGPATSACVSPGAMAFDTSNNLFFIDSGTAIRKITSATGTISTITTNGTFAVSGDNAPPSTQIPGLSLDGQGNLYIADFINRRIRAIKGVGGP